MALFFNLENLEREAKGDSLKFIKMLEYYYKGIYPNKRGRYKRAKLPLTGHSYLLYPEPLFGLQGVDLNFIVQYITLAGKRDYALYQLHGVITLDISFYPDLRLDIIRLNPLLKIVNNQIKFKFEEIYNGKSIRRYQGQGS